jgi:predicted secreted protein
MFRVRFARLALICTLPAVLAGCQTNPAADPWNLKPIVRNIDGSINGTTETIKRGDTLAVHLDASATTGYRWELVRLAGDAVVSVPLADLQPETAAGVPRVGAPGHTTFRFRAMNPGTSAIEVVYRRPWDTTVTGGRVVRFEISVI